jgi:hypothetical protein
MAVRRGCAASAGSPLPRSCWPCRRCEAWRGSSTISAPGGSSRPPRSSSGLVLASLSSSGCYFDEVPSGAARELAWAEEGSGALLPGGGAGALAIGGWFLHRAGMSKMNIIDRSSALFFLTSAVNVAAVVGTGLWLALGGHSQPYGLLRAGIPIFGGLAATAAVLAIPFLVGRSTREWPSWLVEVSAGIVRARRSLRRPHWRLIGAFAYLGFDRCTRSDICRRRAPARRPAARPRLPDRLPRQPDSHPRWLRRSRRRPRRSPHRVRRSPDSGHGRGHRLRRHRLLDPKPWRPRRLHASAPAIQGRQAPDRHRPVRPLRLLPETGGT